MAHSTLAVLSSPDFPQAPEDNIEHTRRRPAWPNSIRTDQAAIEQARRELGPDADPQVVLARAQQIKTKVNRG